MVERLLVTKVPEEQHAAVEQVVNADSADSNTDPGDAILPGPNSEINKVPAAPSDTFETSSEGSAQSEDEEILAKRLADSTPIRFLDCYHQEHIIPMDMARS